MSFSLRSRTIERNPNVSSIPQEMNDIDLLQEVVRLKIQENLTCQQITDQIGLGKRRVARYCSSHCSFFLIDLPNIANVLLVFSIIHRNDMNKPLEGLPGRPKLFSEDLKSKMIAKIRNKDLGMSSLTIQDFVRTERHAERIENGLNSHCVLNPVGRSSLSRLKKDIVHPTSGVDPVSSTSGNQSDFLRCYYETFRWFFLRKLLSVLMMWALNSARRKVSNRSCDLLMAWTKYVQLGTNLELLATKNKIEL